MGGLFVKGSKMSPASLHSPAAGGTDGMYSRAAKC